MANDGMGLARARAAIQVIMVNPNWVGVGGRHLKKGRVRGTLEIQL